MEPATSPQEAGTEDSSTSRVSERVPPRVRRTGIVLRPSIHRVVIRPFFPASDQRVERICSRILALSEMEVETLLGRVLEEFHDRHHKIRHFFLERFEQVKERLITDRKLSEHRKTLIGSYFTQEYALESAALFNPSMVWHPDQANLPEGSRRFLLSLRATGEGHLSSITFRTGVVDHGYRIRMDEPNRFVTAPEHIHDARYEKHLFHRKLNELGAEGPFVSQVLGVLAEEFTLEDLQDAIAKCLLQHRSRQRELESAAQTMTMLARSNYEIGYSPDQEVSERVIFPSSPTEAAGIEDARFVEFHEEDGTAVYLATYTAFDGKVVLPQILETRDFLQFKVNTLNGPEVRNKGFALFPRRVRGLYAMLSRQDNENIYLMYSDNLHFWYTKELVAKPTEAWEFVQLGNCGSPIETERGWLVLTHGVGPMRKYSMGAMLLDLEDPTRVIGRLREPFLEPDALEREGYVPNVVYSCGAVIHQGELIVPYAMSDHASSFASVAVEELLAAMERC